ncbi:MAG: autotransporter outer membrane beta-barrel domain-containing protein [Puniceicoccales bacterium]|jgi:hypothetical protein|nr:autotransporter outer membrane beta-barrel domain-containing protein [Puniceicoccales bacterium]
MGSDFRETAISITNGGEAKGGAGVMNIFGATGKARFGPNAQCSIVRAHSGWIINAYGPMEDVNAVDVDDRSGAAFNAYENLKNITFVNGTTNSLGVSDGIGTITFNGGNLRIAKNGDSGFDDAMDGLKNKMAYVTIIPSSPAVRGSGEIAPSSFAENSSLKVYRGSNEIEINASDYPWKGTAPGGKLILNADDRLVFHVDSSRHRNGSSVNVPAEGDNDSFEFVNGCIFVEEGVEEGIVFNGGKIAIENDDPNNPGFLPAHSDFLIVQMALSPRLLKSADESGEDEDDSPPVPISGLRSERLPDVENLSLHRIVNEEDIVTKVIKGGGYAEWDRVLNVYAYRNGNEAALYVGSGESPLRAIPSALALRQANAELASISIGSISLLRHTITNHLTDVKKNGNDPFIAVANGQFRQDEISGFGYSSSLSGVAGGFDWKYNFLNERHLCVGIALGFFSGHTKFSGEASSRGKSADHMIYDGAIFAAYESFGKNNLKTDINLFMGIGHSRNKLYRMDGNGCEFRGNMKSNNQSAKIEVVKNLISFNGAQIGPWLFIDYNHVNQSAYDESYLNAKQYGAQSLSKVKHNFLDAIIGLNLEKEIQNKNDFDSGLRLFLKAGWHHQLLRKHSSATVKFDVPDLRNVDAYSPLFDYPKKSAVVFVAGLRKKFNQHWEIAGHWNGTFARNVRRNLCSIFLGYDF